MSRVSDFRLILSYRIAGTQPVSGLMWEPETEAFDMMCQRIAGSSTFEGVESTRGNWFVKFALGKGRYRWQMPDEETARKVERYAISGGGVSYARRCAIRSYKYDDTAGRWKNLNIKTSKKWKAQAAEKSKAKRQKRAKQKARDRALRRGKEWSRSFDARLKAQGARRVTC